jgi:hypothetical protein
MGIKSVRTSDGNAGFLIGSGNYAFNCPVEEQVRDKGH